MSLGMVPDSSSCKLLLPHSRQPHLDMKIERKKERKKELFESRKFLALSETTTYRQFNQNFNFNFPSQGTSRDFEPSGISISFSLATEPALKLRFKSGYTCMGYTFIQIQIRRFFKL